MRSGPRHLSVQIDARTQAQSSITGQLVDSWATVRTAWVAPRVASGGEAKGSDRIETRLIYEFLGEPIDWADITNAHRIVINGEHFNIVRIDRASKYQTLIVCELFVGTFVAAA